MAYRTLNEITINSSTLIHNYNYFQSLASYQEIAPVLKANAYGHGLIPVAKVIDSRLKVPFICVDSLYEAYELYKAKVKSPIFIMGYTEPANYSIWKKLPFIFSVFDTASLRALNKYQPGARVHLKLDTGMHRLGLMEGELSEFIRVLKTCRNLVVEGIYSHLASADDPAQSTLTNRQVRSFKEVTSVFEGEGFTFRYRHIAATSGSEIVRDGYFNLARIGLGFYGLSPFGPHTNYGRSQRKHLKPALTLTSRIAMLKEIGPGEIVSYGAAYRAKQQETIAILPLGYNEGIPRDLSNKGVVLAKGGTICPIVGRVCMNMTILKIPRTIKLKQDDPVTVISPDPLAPNSIYQTSNLAKTIPYTILTGLHPSIRRTVI